jgi:hypothetical protein
VAGHSATQKSKTLGRDDEPEELVRDGDGEANLAWMDPQVGAVFGEEAVCEAIENELEAPCLLDYYLGVEAAAMARMPVHRAHALRVAIYKTEHDHAVECPVRLKHRARLVVARNGKRPPASLLS